MAHHAEALDAQASGEAAPALWIEAHAGEHGGVDHAAAHHLQPAATPLHIHLGAGFGEGEVAGPKAHWQVAEKLLQKGRDGAAQVAEVQALINRQHLHLVEHGRVGGIHGVAAIHPPWGDHPHWRWVVLQVADLHRRGVGAQQLAIAQIKGVLHVPGGVMLGDVEGREVVVVALDLRPLRYPISQAGKDVDDLLDRAD